jgi:hypothetical protein
MNSQITQTKPKVSRSKNKNYGDYFQPVYILITNLFNFWEIPFIDDFIKLIDYNGNEYGGIDLLAIAALGVDIFTHYIRYSNRGKYIYIHTQYIIFRGYVINIKDISNIFIKPIDYATFESANTLVYFTPLHNKQITISQQQIDSIKEQSSKIRNALDVLDGVINSLNT